MRSLLAVLICAALAAVDAPAQVLVQAHAHNDYVHARPLLDALEHGFMSVEADIWLVDGQLLVAHDRADCSAERTLRALYLEPLRARVQSHGGRVHRDGPLEFQLLIDFKSGGAATWRALRAELADFAALFTRFDPDGRTPGPVLAVLSGGAPDELVLAEPTRLCALDGWFDDLEAGSTGDQHPLLSASWLAHFRWTGHGPFPADERRRLRAFVTRAHAAGRKLRFWAVPNRQRIWEEQLACGVDWLNLDNLPSARRFLSADLAERAIGRELDAWLDDRFGDPAATRTLAASLDARGIGIEQVERILRRGPVELDDPGLAAGTLHADLPLVCDHVDYQTSHFLYLPADHDPTLPHPLVLIGHGGNGAMPRGYARRAAEAGIRAWIPTADRHGLILAAPLSERGWGAIGNSILLSLVSRLQRQFRIDPDRIHVTGHSMGGHLTWRSALTMADRWAAVSPMSGGYDYVERGQMPLLSNVPGYATFGRTEPYGIDGFNRRMRAWLGERGYDWQVVEKDGGHEIFGDELPKIAAFFAERPRDRHRAEVWAQAGRVLRWDQADANPRWGVEHHWRADRPIPFGSFHWLRLPDAPGLADGQLRRVQARLERDARRIRIEAERTPRLELLLHPRLVDFDAPLEVIANGERVFAGRPAPDLLAMLSLVREFDDRGRTCWARLELEIPGEGAPVEPRR
jgi:hypothetical protein